MVTLPEELDELVPLLDPTGPPRVLTRAQAAARGYSDARIRHRVASGRWTRMATGVYLTVPDCGPADRRQAAVAHGGPTCVLTGMAALAAWGLPVGEVWQELVLVPHGCRVRSSGRIRVRQTRRMPRRMWASGVPVAPVERAVADSVRLLRELDDVRAVVALAVQHRRATVEQLDAELRRGQRNGSALFRQAVAEVRLGARSAPEARAATALRRAGVGGFEQNVPVLAGGQRYEADFLWRELRAILEIDSRKHHFEPADWQATMIRHANLETAGYSVIHVSPAELADEAAFVARAAAWLDSRRAWMAGR